MAGREQKRRHPSKVNVKQAPWAALAQGNPIKQAEAKFNEISTKAKAWMARQPAPVEIGLVTITQGLQGAFIGGLMGQLVGDLQMGMPEAAQAPGQSPKPQTDSMKVRR